MKPVTIVSNPRLARPAQAAAQPRRKPTDLDKQSPGLAAHLSRHLELEPLLSQFSRCTGDYVPHDSLTFRHEFAGSEQTIVFGAAARHSCTYQLTVEDMALGSLALTRRRRFEEAELALIEQLVGVIVYPLRNALLYYRAQHDAATDRLTGLSNRAVFNDALVREVRRAQRYGTALTLLMADLDNLKPINDRLGHSAGDRVLQQVAQALRAGVRDSDHVFRYAGDEFAVLLIGSDGDAARDVAERLRALVAETSGEPMQPSVSVGLASLRVGENAETLFERADAALYAAKRAGRNCVCSAD
jgi:diguanylate cyclase (GGDEF)-like protein